MNPALPARLSRREREVMEVLYRLGQASAADVQSRLPGPPSYSAVRAILSVLEDKGHVKHHRVRRRFVYLPTESPKRAKRSAIRRLLATFFDDSPEKLVASLLDPSENNLSPAEIDRVRTVLQSQPRPDGSQPGA
ncbi:MAG TPA: BlaI/MecI/CopY family transcriptional regulator [Verrucomicrobiales bacterium]|nr:BlaI/MecI/CopY family transcriptional regulator [Verrucomicrobiales bacterium]